MLLELSLAFLITGHHKTVHHKEAKPEVETSNGEVRGKPKSNLNKESGKRHCSFAISHPGSVDLLTSSQPHCPYTEQEERRI